MSRLRSVLAACGLEEGSVELFIACLVTSEDRFSRTAVVELSSIWVQNVGAEAVEIFRQQIERILTELRSVHRPYLMADSRPGIAWGTAQPGYVVMFLLAMAS